MVKINSGICGVNIVVVVVGGGGSRPQAPVVLTQGKDSYILPKAKVLLKWF